MSKLKGKEILRSLEITELGLGFEPSIKWNKTEEAYVLKVPDMYEVLMNGIVSNVPFVEVRIDEPDIWRMITAEQGIGDSFWFNFDEERGELDDDTYLGISLIQAEWYLSVNVLNLARRAMKRCGYPQWIKLKKRTPRGGRPVGSKSGSSGGFDSLNAEEQQRLCDLDANYNRVVENCYEHDWLDEYIELQKDMCLFRREKFCGRKECAKRFAEERKKWLNSK